MTILNVRRIGFYGKTGDDRSPEDFPFPAAMTSIMELKTPLRGAAGSMCACQGRRCSRLFGYHHAILFNLAEARCWCGDFLLKHGVEAGNHFKNIHDLCWKADAAVHTAADMAEYGKKRALIGVMKAIREEDRAALNELKAML